jgi:hypothetical protein
MRGDGASDGGEDARQLASKEARSLPNSNTTFQQKGADLVDDAGALAHQRFKGRNSRAAGLY